MGDHWRDQAACKGRHHLFDLIDRESSFRRDVEDLVERDKLIKSYNLSNFNQAKSICESCPVFFECKDSAKGEDHAWTFRAGKLPYSLRVRAAGRPVGSKSRPVDWKTRACRKGHVGHYALKSGQYRCTECARMVDRDYRQRKGMKPRPPRADYLPGTCRHGHVDKYLPDKRDSKYCAECARIYSKEKRERNKAARMPS